MAASNSFEGRLEIGEGLDVVDLRGLDEGCDAAPGAAALVMAGEQCIFPVQGNWPDQILDTVAIDLDTAVVEEGLQTVPVTMDVGKLLAEAGLGGDPAALLLQPLSEGGDQRRGAGLPCREPLPGRRSADIGLDPVEVGDPAQAFGGDLGAVSIEHLLQFPPCVRPAMGHADRIATLAGRARQAVVALVAVKLQDPVEATKDFLRVFSAAV